jgi:hypothetical protein
MNKKRKAKRFKKGGLPVSEIPFADKSLISGAVALFGMMAFGDILRTMHEPTAKVGSIRKDRMIDNTQDGDAEIISSKIKDNATGI